MRKRLLPFLLLLSLAASHTARAQVLFPGQGARPYVFSLKFSASVVLRVEARLKTGGWDTEGAESAVFDLKLDSQPYASVVVAHRLGRAYEVLLGPLAPGNHQVGLVYDRALSRNPKGIVLGRVTHQVLAPGSAQAQAAQNAPFLHIDSYRLATDMPVAMTWEQKGQDWFYEVYFTGEDGGTGLYPGALMGVWGRVADIEGALWGREGQWFVQGPGHGTDPLVVAPGQRPALRVCTDNGMFCPLSGSHPLRLSLPPRPMPPGGVREHLLDADPWLARLVGEEALREKGTGGKPKVNLPHTPQSALLGHPRGYLYLDMACDGPPEGMVAALVKVKGQEKPFKSNNSQGLLVVPGNLGQRCGGPARKTVKLPLDLKPQDIEALGLVNLSPTATVIGRITKAHLLGPNYAPLSLPLDLLGGVRLSPKATGWITPAPAPAAGH